MIQYNTIKNKTRKHNKTEQYIMKYTKKILDQQFIII